MYKNCKVVMLPSEGRAKIGSITKSSRSGNLGLYDEDKINAENKGLINWNLQHLYITSDEEIKEGDWYLVELFNIEGISSGLHLEPVVTINDVWVNSKEINYTRHINNCKKIIASTNPIINLLQPSPTFIIKYIEEYNKGNIITEIMVEYEDYNSEDPFQFELYQKLKVNPKDNTINIDMPKDNWTKEEIREKLNKFCLDFSLHHGCQVLPHEIDHWITKNL